MTSVLLFQFVVIFMTFRLRFMSHFRICLWFCDLSLVSHPVCGQSFGQYITADDHHGGCVYRVCRSCPLPSCCSEKETEGEARGEIGGGGGTKRKEE